MATAAQIQNAIDTDFAARVAALNTLQTTYRSGKTEFFQGLKTHTTIPADNIAVIPDNLSSHPSDQADSWVTFGVAIAVAITYAIICDVYDGPQGKGYVWNTVVIILGVKWARSYNVGPETNRDAAWRIIN